MGILIPLLIFVKFYFYIQVIKISGPFTLFSNHK